MSLQFRKVKIRLWLIHYISLCFLHWKRDLSLFSFVWLSLQFRKLKILRFVAGLNFWGYFNRSFLPLPINSRFYVRMALSFSLYMEGSRKTTKALKYRIRFIYLILSIYEIFPRDARAEGPILSNEIFKIFKQIRGRIGRIIPGAYKERFGVSFTYCHH